MIERGDDLALAFHGSKIILSFDHVGGGLDLFDVQKPVGFTIAGADQQFQHAGEDSEPAPDRGME